MILSPIVRLGRLPGPGRDIHWRRPFLSGAGSVALLLLASVAGAADVMDEVRQHFAYGGKPIDPRVVQTFIDTMDAFEPYVLAVDLAAIGDGHSFSISHDPHHGDVATTITVNPDGVVDAAHIDGVDHRRYSFGYRFIGSLPSGTLVVQTYWRACRGEVQERLLLLSAAVERGIGGDGVAHVRRVLRLVRMVDLGDRVQAQVAIRGAEALVDRSHARREDDRESLTVTETSPKPDAARAQEQAQQVQELREHFTHGGKPIHPGLIGEFIRDDGDGPGVGLRPFALALDLGQDDGRFGDGGAGSVHVGDGESVQKGVVMATYFDPRLKYRYGIGYKFIGCLPSGTLVVDAINEPGGNGSWEYLLMLAADIEHGFGWDGEPHDRQVLRVLSVLALGDRRNPDIAIRGGKVVVGFSQAKFEEDRTRRPLVLDDPQTVLKVPSAVVSEPADF
jgi:hypothetical protein